MDVAFDAARHHQLFAVVAFCVAQERRDQQRLPLHQAVHGSLRREKGASPPVARNNMERDQLVSRIRLRRSSPH